MKKSLVLAKLILLFYLTIYAQKKEVMYLSGTDNENTVEWDFFCTGGRNSGFWTKIPVPSHWEQMGFGSYNYGRDYYTYGKGFKFADEKGIYRYEFKVPQSWKNKRIFIVFEGSMTDTEVKINGKIAGPIHQGAFYRFSYDITQLLDFNNYNLLEVTVSKMSSNNSVNRAERYADYWIFGGIYRPVYLEAYPQEYISHVAIDAKADGTFKAYVTSQGLTSNRQLEVKIYKYPEFKLAKSGTFNLNSKDSVHVINLKVENPELWTSETPNLYKAIFILKNNKKTLFETSEKFGFRTIEVKHGDGIYINGTRVVMKGINRHAFWPETGRCLNKKIDLMDVKLIKEMNMNAVRCSHYPPDKSFLEICDSIGLYVIDELAGWQNYYDTEVGSKLVKEMILRDVNHPSIIFWSNGNEGGHNFELLPLYHKYDPSKRPVIHAHHRPGNAINGIDCDHYEPYESVKRKYEDTLIYMTTEFLHCQNDGGGGAGLFDYWELMRTSPRSGGGFLWAFIDEGVVRTDLNNAIDVNKVNAPDGVVGPYREKEGSYYAIKEILSHVWFLDKELQKPIKELNVENRFYFTNLNKCNFLWKLVKFHSPVETLNGYITIGTGIIENVNVEPGKIGKIVLNIPDSLQLIADALIIDVSDKYGNHIITKTWKLKTNTEFVSSIVKISGKLIAKVEENDSTLKIQNGESFVIFDKKTGLIKNIQTHNGNKMHFGNGPILVPGNQKLLSFKHYKEDSTYVVFLEYEKNLNYVKWTFYPTGWIKLSYKYSLNGKFNYAGISFSYPEDLVISARWLGNGPYRVWKNRMHGGNINVWENLYNNTVTGYYPWNYPEFKGYFSNMTWLELNTCEGKIYFVTPEENTFFRLFDFYALPGIEPHPELPAGDISFLDYIPPTGTKMSININAQPSRLGPQSEPNVINQPVEKNIFIYPGLLY